MTRGLERKHSNCSQETEDLLTRDTVLETMCLSEEAVLLCTVVLPYGPGWMQTRDCPVCLWRLRTTGGHVPSCPAPRDVQLSHLGYTSGQEHTRHTTAAKERRTVIIVCCFSVSVICSPDSKFIWKSKRPRSLNTISRENGEQAAFWLAILI